MGGLSGAGRSASCCFWMRMWRRLICRTRALCSAWMPRLLLGVQFFAAGLMSGRTLASSTTRDCDLDSYDCTAFRLMVVSACARLRASVAARRRCVHRLRIQASFPRPACRRRLAGADFCLTRLSVPHTARGAIDHFGRPRGAVLLRFLRQALRSADGRTWRRCLRAPLAGRLRSSQRLPCRSARECRRTHACCLSQQPDLVLLSSARAPGTDCRALRV
jgi:hypothetical protein